MRWITTKTNNGPHLQYKKFSVLELALTDRRNLSGTRPKSTCSKSSSYWFSFSAMRSAITKATEYVTFGFSSHREKFERHCLWAIRIFQCFNSHNPKKSLTNDLGLRMVKALPDRVARKASDVSAADWRCQTQVKRYRIFSRVLLRLFSGLEILV